MKPAGLNVANPTHLTHLVAELATWYAAAPRWSAASSLDAIFLIQPLPRRAPR